MVDTRPRGTARDWPRASRDVARAYFPHTLRPLGGAHPPRLTLHTLDLGACLVGQVGWGADVAIECDYPDSLEVNLPLTGHLESRGRFGTLTSVAGQGTVFRPDTPSLISHWDATCTVVGVKFDRAWIELEAERILATDRARVDSLLPEQLNCASGTAAAWHQFVLGLVSHLPPGRPGDQTDPFRHQLASAVATGFLTAFVPDGPAAGTARPRAIRQVVDAVHDDPARPWVAADLAELAGTSVRRLQEGFRHWLGCTPMQYVTEVRLTRAHCDLRDSHLTVADVSARWGFSSPSRFAAAYAKRYGTTPSANRR
ncbi:AraC family transcriptional regulator [uncultured Nocardioides sp.]|uniref:AraC family transcriptional regulator n=2 Tax=uncultured Nocardioides sp. TaxID=198441 RepID=UPI00262DEF30|nr:AraC family transcriptional regulator [uncultured Nocardioides sp.]